MVVEPEDVPRAGQIDPREVRFSQRSASWTFKDGTTVGELIEGLRSGRVLAQDVEPIRILLRGGALWTLDNRRLEAFRRAGISVPYRLATMEEMEEEGWKFTTQNDGATIILRGEPR